MATLYLVSTPIGNLGDLSPRAGETLAAVSRILAEDTRRTRPLLIRLGVKVPLVSFHAHNEAAREETVLGWLGAGEDVGLVSDAGTPLVSDPGERLVQAVLASGHSVVPIPGPSAILAALVASGLPTHRFTFLGFLPRKGRERKELFERLTVSPETTVLFESPERLVALLEALAERSSPARRCAVARELTKLHEEFVRGSLAEVAAHFVSTPPRGEVTLVLEGVGEGGAESEADRADASALARTLLEEGMSPSRAAKEVVRRLGISRNQAYELVHSVAEGGENGDAPSP